MLPKAETFTGITLQLITLIPPLLDEIVTATLYDGFIPVFICPLVIPFFIPPGVPVSASCTGSAPFAAQDAGYVGLSISGSPYGALPFTASVGLATS